MYNFPLTPTKIPNVKKKEKRDDAHKETKINKTFWNEN